jgi:hypothetical protein
MIKTSRDEALSFSRYTSNSFTPRYQVITKVDSFYLRSSIAYQTLATLMNVLRVSDRLGRLVWSLTRLYLCQWEKDCRPGRKEQLFSFPRLIINRIASSIREFWSIRWFRFVVPNVTYVSIAQSHPARVASFAAGTHRSCLTSSCTALRQWTAVWHQYDQCLRGIDDTHPQHSRVRPASVARNDCDLISDQRSWDDTFIDCALRNASADERTRLILATFRRTRKKTSSLA